MLEPYDLSNQFKTHSQKQEENRGGWWGGWRKVNELKEIERRLKGRTWVLSLFCSWILGTQNSCVLCLSHQPFPLMYLLLRTRVEEELCTDSWCPGHLTSWDTHLLNRREWGQVYQFACWWAVGAICVSWWEHLRVQNSLILNVLAGRLIWRWHRCQSRDGMIMAWSCHSFLFWNILQVTDLPNFNMSCDFSLGLKSSHYCA